MYFDWVYFAEGAVMLLSGAWLCLYPVKDELTIPLGKALPLAALIIMVHSASLSMVGGDLFNTSMLYFMPLCFYAYQRLVRADRRKLLFLFFVVASYVCFCATQSMSFETPLPAATPWEDVNQGLGTLIIHVLCIYPMTLLLGRKVWPVIRELHAAEWGSLWIIPLIFTSVATVITVAMNETQIYTWLYRAAMLLLAVGALTSYYLIVRMMQKTAHTAQLHEQARMMRLQLMQQREQYETLSEGIAHARRARHDLRHSLLALKGYAQLEDIGGLRDHLQQMIGALPQDEEPLYCKNYAVNAMARHYLGLAREAGVAVTARLDIPEGMGHVLELDLCVLVGNMLENAVEACAAREAHGALAGEAWIDALAAVDGEYLTVSVTNSFDGDVRMQGGVHLSRKHEGEGIGISSIRAIAEKYQGYASFVAQGRMFEASAVVRLGCERGSRDGWAADTQG